MMHLHCCLHLFEISLLDGVKQLKISIAQNSLTRSVGLRSDIEDMFELINLALEPPSDFLCLGGV